MNVTLESTSPVKALPRLLEGQGLRRSSHAETLASL
jgi:hypothetical protein